jgi:hypothetical protein
MANPPISRRGFLKAAGAAGAVLALPAETPGAAVAVESEWIFHTPGPARPWLAAYATAGSINSAPIFGCDPGTVLFAGIWVEYAADGTRESSYGFLYRPHGWGRRHERSDLHSIYPDGIAPAPRDCRINPCLADR